MSMRPFSGTVRGNDGLPYSVRFLLTDDERESLERAGVLPVDTCEIVGMQSAVDQTCLRFEIHAHLANGGKLQ